MIFRPMTGNTQGMRLRMSPPRKSDPKSSASPPPASDGAEPDVVAPAAVATGSESRAWRSPKTRTPWSVAGALPACASSFSG